MTLRKFKLKGQLPTKCVYPGSVPSFNTLGKISYECSIQELRQSCRWEFDIED
ncbi:hypothetical protein L208DRAFT_1417154 [Tricholoma matsutake]|nr:hypothetical protein L208DRAFT_1417153 [Tricholoma matsutake 945]KAF8220123.1 hypothetical protein L208DRAFT_1417154 [Tricholoma matsutake 945]